MHSTRNWFKSEVRKAQVLTQTHEEYLWSVGLLGSENPDQLLNTLLLVRGVPFMLERSIMH